MVKKTKTVKPTKFTFTPLTICLILLGIVIGCIVGYYLGDEHRKDTKAYRYGDKEQKQQARPYSHCKSLTVNAPGNGEQITSPVTVTVVVDNTNPECRWTVFEAHAGRMELQNANGQVIGTGALKTTDEWMTDQPVTYSGEMMFDTNLTTPKLNLVINEENPSGEPGQQIIQPLTY